MADKTKIVLALTSLAGLFMCVRINPLSHCIEDDGRWLPLLRPPPLTRLIVSQHIRLPQALRHCCCCWAISGIVPFPFLFFIFSGFWLASCHIMFRGYLAASYFSVCLTLPDTERAQLHVDKSLYMPLVSFWRLRKKNKTEKVDNMGFIHVHVDKS